MAHTLTMKLGIFAGQRAREQAHTEQATFEALVEQSWNDLWRYAYRTTGNRDEAEDLLSETLLEGFRSFAQFRGETPFIRWMYRVMTTTRIDMVRKAARRRTESLDGPLDSAEALRQTRDFPDEAANPERILLAPLLSEPLQQALDGLSEEFRAVIVLADMQQMDYVEVSQVLQIPLGTVRSRLHRARGLLRKALAGYVRR